MSDGQRCPLCDTAAVVDACDGQIVCPNPTCRRILLTQASEPVEPDAPRAGTAVLEPPGRETGFKRCPLCGRALEILETMPLQLVCPDPACRRARARSQQPAPIAPAPATLRLDLASGQSPRHGFEGVDIWEGAAHRVDLQQYPWPFADESVLELNCSHYCEHIPMEMVYRAQGEGPGYQDALFAFFDECWRILAPDGWLHIVVPAHRSDRAFQDPTHRRFITAQTFAYMNEAWRRANRLDHYNVVCNFIGDCNPVVMEEMNLRSPEVAHRMIQREWNTVVDWKAELQKKPRLPPVGQ